MTTIDWLIRHVVLHQPFLRNKIFYHVRTALNCRTINYKFCIKLGFLLSNQYFELIKLKLQNKEYLYLDDSIDARIGLFKLKDVDLFIAIFNQLDDNDYAIINTIDDILMFCLRLQKRKKQQQDNDSTSYDNKILEYLLFGQQRLVLKKTVNFYKAICKRGYLKIIQCLKDDFNRFLSFEYKYFFSLAISSKNILLVKELYDKNLFNKLELHDKEDLLAESVQTGSIELFTLVSEYFANSFFIFKLRRKEFYNDSLLFYFFISAIKSNSFDMYMHIINTFGMSFLDQEQTIHPSLLALEFPTKEIIDHLLSKNLVPSSQVLHLCVCALQKGKYALYEQLQTYFNVSFVTIRECYELVGAMNIPYDDITRVDYLVNKLMVPINFEDVVRSASYPETFKLLFTRLNKSELPDLYAQINSIIFNACMGNAGEVLLCLYNEFGGDFPKALIWDWIPLDCTLKTLQIALTIDPPTQEIVPSLFKVLEQLAQTCKNNISVFELLFDVMYNGPSPLTRDPNDYIGVFKGAIRGGRILTLQYLYNQGLTIPTKASYIEILKDAAQYGRLTIIKYILEHQQQYSIPLTPLIETSMKAHKYDCVDYLLPKEVSQTLTIKELVQYCTNYINIQESQLMS